MTDMAVVPTVLAALRDASWLSKPDTRTPKRAHVLRDDGSAACGLVAVMCDPEPAEDVPDWQRCKRPGCWDKWPTPSDGQAMHTEQNVKGKRD